MALITGIDGDVAVQNITFGISLGIGHLMDKYHEYWMYQGKPFIGFTLGLNLNLKKHRQDCLCSKQDYNEKGFIHLVTVRL